MKKALLFGLGLVFSFQAQAGLSVSIKETFKDEINDVAFSMNEQTDAMIETPISADGKRAYYLACIPTDYYGNALAMLRVEDVAVKDGKLVYSNNRLVATGRDTFLNCTGKAAKLRGANVEPRTIKVLETVINDKVILGASIEVR